jgi:hypothetical protein
MSAFLDWLTSHTLGPKCTLCGERRRGWRTLDAHLAVDHAGDAGAAS